MIKKERYNVAVVGATGAVGRKMLEVLAERKFPVATLKVFASAKSAGQTLTFDGAPVTVAELRENSFAGMDIALFSIGAVASRQFARAAVKSGCVVIDNSSAFRMEPDVPLVVPEVNAAAINSNVGIIANPNCATIQMVVVLKPIHDKYKIKRVVVSTYQSVSGSGQKAIRELQSQTKNLLAGKPAAPDLYPHQIAFNCLPHIDIFLSNGYSKEEMKMVDETRKILGDSSIMVSPTTVRVPVFYSHSESINVETLRPINAAEVRELLSAADGVCVTDNPAANEYPLAVDVAGKDDVFVGRIRDDISCENAVNFWVVSDNLRKGAALNAVQIAEYLAAGRGVSQR